MRVSVQTNHTATLHRTAKTAVQLAQDLFRDGFDGGFGFRVFSRRFIFWRHGTGDTQSPYVIVAKLAFLEAVRGSRMPRLCLIFNRSWICGAVMVFGVTPSCDATRIVRPQASRMPIISSKLFGGELRPVARRGGRRSLPIKKPGRPAWRRRARWPQPFQPSTWLPIPLRASGPA